MSNVNISFKPTGDPFVDAGGNALKYLMEMFSEKSISDLIELATEIYVTDWGKNVYNVFHTNAVKKLGTESLRMVFDSYIKEIELSDSQGSDKMVFTKKRNCEICGQLTILYPSSREFFPLTGSGALVNYYTSHKEGSLICGNCSIKLFFLPLIVIQTGEMLALLHTENQKSQEYWIKKTIAENISKISKKISVGIIKSEFGNPKNALFKFASDIITEVNDDTLSDYLQLYHFTNFGAAPNCDIYRLPNPIFLFLNKVIRYCHSDWYVFIQKHYHIKKSSWDYTDDQWISGKDNQPMSEEDYLNNPNDVFGRLLNGDSILGFLRKFYKDAYIHNKRHSQVTMAIYYIKEVLGMRQEQINLIKKVANVVFDLAQKENNYKKYLVMLEGAGKAYQLRSVLLRIIKENYKSGAAEPVIRLQDYVDYLFPDGQFWGEVRDLMLIYLYERLHDENINRQDVVDSLDIVETTEETNEGA
ncbi:MAG: type I-B CRISPR-associated protein Cas8b1/Cst1 [Candidatus Marinimicrobia bacterium]|nr:type I-B CRISPR-associated protein Cas8b1/Cst1 [Candidatus Neomarinimicrobiota bacterium]